MPTFSNPASPEGRESTGARLSRLQATYRSRFRAGLLAAAAAAVLAMLLALWMVPWVPIGMTLDDYEPAVWMGFVLATGCALMGLLAFFTREPASTESDISDLWRWLMGRGVRLRNRTQFTHALAREYRRAQRDRRSPLSLILIRVASSDGRGGPGSSDLIEHVAQTIAKHIRLADVLGLVGDEELGVLALGADAEAQQAVKARTERAVAAAMVEWNGAKTPGKASAVSIGASTLGPDDDADSLIAAAQQALEPLATHAARAA